MDNDLDATPPKDNGDIPSGDNVAAAAVPPLSTAQTASRSETASAWRKNPHIPPGVEMNAKTTAMEFPASIDAGRSPPPPRRETARIPTVVAVAATPLLFLTDAATHDPTVADDVHAPDDSMASPVVATARIVPTRVVLPQRDPPVETEPRKQWAVSIAVGAAVLLLIGVGVGSTVAVWNRKSTHSNDPTVPNQSPPTGTTVNASRPFAMELAWIVNNATLTGRVIDLLDATQSTEQLEELALQWLAWNDTLMRSTRGAVNRFQVVQRYALWTLLLPAAAAAAAAVTSVSIPASTHECQWAGITCRSVDTVLGAGGPPQWVVTDLVPTSVVGTLSPDCGLLSFVERVNVSSHEYLVGSIPAAWGAAWTRLVSFHVGGNRLTGTLPSTMAQWTQLESFHVMSNAFVGTLPSAIGVAWSNLVVLDVGRNQLEGTLPAGMGSTWTKLEYFYLVDNAFSGTLSSSIGQWTNLVVFYVVKNFLSGTIPESIVNWTRIERADFALNNFVGPVPMGLCAAPNLIDLDADCELQANNVSEVNCSCCTNCF